MAPQSGKRCSKQTKQTLVQRDKLTSKPGFEPGLRARTRARTPVRFDFSNFLSAKQYSKRAIILEANRNNGGLSQVSSYILYRAWVGE